MYRPFYWLDIVKTQDMLSQMSEKGLILEDVNFVLGTFKFKKGEPQKNTYLIRRSSGCRGNVPRKLLSSGWEKLGKGSRNNWCAVYHGTPEADDAPSFGSYLTLLSVSKILCFFVMCFVFGTVWGMSMAFEGRSELPPDHEKYIADVSDYWVRVIKEDAVQNIIYLTALVISIILMIVFTKATKRYEKLNGKSVDIDFTIPKENFTYTKAEEKKLIKEKRMIAKSKPGWFYSPDKAEEYVEKMEREGWNFYRFDKMGTTFYFIKGEPRNVRFIVDYQDEISDEYLNMNIEDGWKLQFKSIARVGGYIVWLKECENGEEDIYTDRESLLSRAKKLALIYGLVFIPVVVIYTMLIILLNKEQMAAGFNLYMIVIFIVVIVEYGIFAGKSIGYYLRIRKKYNR